MTADNRETTSLSPEITMLKQILTAFPHQSVEPEILMQTVPDFVKMRKLRWLGIHPSLTSLDLDLNHSVLMTDLALAHLLNRLNTEQIKDINQLGPDLRILMVAISKDLAKQVGINAAGISIGLLEETGRFQGLKELFYRLIELIENSNLYPETKRELLSQTASDSYLFMYPN